MVCFFLSSPPLLGFDVRRSANRFAVDYEKTSLKPYIDYFKTFVNGLLQDEAKVKREREGNGGNSMEF